MEAGSPYRRVLRNRAFLRLLVGETVSGIGDWLYLVAILVVVYELTADPVVLGVVGAARLVPFVLLSVPAGMAADRFDRRTILLVSDVGRGILMLVLAGLVAAGAPVVAIVGIAIVAACFSAFFGPAIGAYIPRVVGDERDLGTANSLWATLDNVAYFIGPAVAGLLIAAGGLGLAFLLNAISFGFVALVLLTLPPAPPHRAGTPSAEDETASVPEPIGRIELLRRIAVPLLVDWSTSFTALATSILIVLLAIEQLDAGAAAVGYLEAATGVGGVIAGVAAGGLVARRLDLPLVAGALVGGVGLAILGATASLPVALVVIGVAIGAVVLIDIIVMTLVQRLVADELRGRAMGVLQLSGVTGALAGSLLAPIAADVFGLGVVFGAMGLLLVAAAAAAAAVLARQGALAARPDIDPQRIALLRRTILAGAPPGRLESAASAMEERVVAPGEVVIAQGTAADRFYVIADGRFEVTQAGPDGAERHLRELGPGEPFGEIGLLAGTPRTATVTALTDGRLLALEREAFLALVGGGPDLTESLLALYRTAPSRP